MKGSFGSNSMHSRNAFFEAAIYSPLIPGTNKVSRLHMGFDSVHRDYIPSTYNMLMECFCRHQWKMIAFFSAYFTVALNHVSSPAFH